MTISVAVMAHPSRRHLVDELLERLATPAEVVFDRWGDEWDTARRAWETHDPAASHHLVLQDDSLPCLDLVAGLDKALAYVPTEAVVSLYTGTGQPHSQVVGNAVTTADRLGAAWIRMRSLYWGVAVCAPTAVIADMLAFGDECQSVKYDRKAARFFYEHLVWPVWCTWPCLVDHRDVRSILQPTVMVERRARRFADGSALDVDWSTGHVDSTDINHLNVRRRS